MEDVGEYTEIQWTSDSAGHDVGQGGAATVRSGDVGMNTGTGMGITSSQHVRRQQAREEEERERVEIHPLMGGSARVGSAAKPVQSKVSQSASYQMTKARQLARSVMFNGRG